MLAFTFFLLTSTIVQPTWDTLLPGAIVNSLLIALIYWHRSRLKAAP